MGTAPLFIFCGLKTTICACQRPRPKPESPRKTPESTQNPVTSCIPCSQMARSGKPIACRPKSLFSICSRAPKADSAPCVPSRTAAPRAQTLNRLLREIAARLKALHHIARLPPQRPAAQLHGPLAARVLRCSQPVDFKGSATNSIATIPLNESASCYQTRSGNCFQAAAFSRARRACTASDSRASSASEASQPRQASVMLWP